MPDLLLNGHRFAGFKDEEPLTLEVNILTVRLDPSSRSAHFLANLKHKQDCTGYIIGGYAQLDDQRYKLIDGEILEASSQAIPDQTYKAVIRFSTIAKKGG